MRRSISRFLSRGDYFDAAISYECKTVGVAFGVAGSFFTFRSAEAQITGLASPSPRKLETPSFATRSSAGSAKCIGVTTRSPAVRPDSLLSTSSSQQNKVAIPSTIPPSNARWSRLSPGSWKTPISAAAAAVGAAVRAADRLMSWPLRGAVMLYQTLVSPLLPPACRFYPSCSNYADQALSRHGALRGGWYTARRLIRCHPFCDGGHDPVPPTRLRAKEDGRINHGPKGICLGHADTPGGVGAASPVRYQGSRDGAAPRLRAATIQLNFTPIAPHGAAIEAPLSPKDRS